VAHPHELLGRMDALYERLVPGAAPFRRMNLPVSPAAAWTPKKGSTTL